MADTRLNRGAWMAIGWGSAYLILAGVIGLELDWGRHIHPPLPAPKPIPAARVDYPVQPEFTLPTLEQGFAETTARPMFTPVRRPPPPPSVQAKSTMQKGQFALLGALITRDKSIAMLRDISSGKAIRVEQGKEIRGMTVTRIDPEKVILTQDGETEELVLKIQPSAKPPAAPKAAPAQQPAQPQAVPQAAAGVPPVSAPSATTSADGAGDAQSLINRRRATRGLPPI
ncbi:MAG: hypothetical protein NUV75_03835 [Gallionella sp.]|nr:hypothetical protein [Gallionella sp.]